MKIDLDPNGEVTIPPRDPFFPPPDVEAECFATLKKLQEGLPGVPNCPYPTTVNGPSSYDRNTSIQVMNAVAQWSEHLGTQIGIRKARHAALAAGVKWMDGYVKFAFKGKTDKLTETQFERLQRDQFEMDCVQAEIFLLDSKMAALAKAFQAASRNLTGLLNT